ncbi:hypothetical protein H6S82_31025, partial [Planktothrix sp. FACHB-1355]
IVFQKRHFIPVYLKILFVGLTTGMVLNMFLYGLALWFNFFFVWLGIVCIVSKIGGAKQRLYAAIMVLIIYLSSQSLNIISLAGREYLPSAKYQQIREAFLAKPNRKYAIDEVAARFVFDYKLPKNSIDLTFMGPVNAPLLSAKDKPSDVTWIASTHRLAMQYPELNIKYPRVEFLGRSFNSLPKKPFELTVIP